MNCTLETELRNILNWTQISSLSAVFLYGAMSHQNLQNYNKPELRKKIWLFRAPLEDPNII